MSSTACCGLNGWNAACTNEVPAVRYSPATRVNRHWHSALADAARLSGPSGASLRGISTTPAAVSDHSSSNDPSALYSTCVNRAARTASMSSTGKSCSTTSPPPLPEEEDEEDDEEDARKL